MLVKYLLAVFEISLGSVMFCLMLLSISSRQFIEFLGLDLEASIWLTPSQSFLAFLLFSSKYLEKYSFFAVLNRFLTLVFLVS